jgi:hypothetical protein
MKGIFWDFCINQFLVSPSHYISSRSDFDFKFAEIFVIEKRWGVDKIELPFSSNF